MGESGSGDGGSDGRDWRGARPGGAGTAESDARWRPALETLFQELVRRGTSLGLSSFFLTEEAVRRALADSVPADWVDYMSRQGAEMRRDLVEALAREFGAWLRAQDAEELLQRCLEDYDVSAQIELRVEPRAGRGDALRVVTRRK